MAAKKAQTEQNPLVHIEEGDRIMLRRTDDESPIPALEFMNFINIKTEGRPLMALGRGVRGPRAGDRSTLALIVQIVEPDMFDGWWKTYRDERPGLFGPTDTGVLKPDDVDHLSVNVTAEGMPFVMEELPAFEETMVKCFGRVAVRIGGGGPGDAIRTIQEGEPRAKLWVVVGLGDAPGDAADGA